MTDRCPARLYHPEDLPGMTFDPVFLELLRDEPVARIRMRYGEGEAWLVTRYEDVKFVTSDPRFSRKIMGRPFPKMTRHHIPMDRAVSFSDPPEHARVRRVVARDFSPGSVERLRPTAEKIMHRCLDELVAAGPPADLVRHVTSPFPMAVLGELMGIPESDRPWLIECSSQVLSMAPDQAAVDRINGIKAEVAEYFLALVESRRADPRDDVVSTVAAARERGDLDDEEVAAMTVLLALNGWHAVRNNSTNMVYVLLTDPELRSRLKADLGLVPTAVEELLRYIPHKRGIGQPRIATEDVEIRGVRISKGDVVYVSYVAANWDEDVYPEPDRVDLDRPEVPHLAFGHGPHYCMGPMLARMESQVLLSSLLTRLPDLALAVPPEQVAWQPNALIRGPLELPVTW
ncbi:cytochrome P450 [Saccharopolyspora erythraea]|uniref:cytochrome P450 n=1 Tax=Saccharopolyspora erythraea TaxID=1836 RepID=UPI001BAC9A3A|nr:cytochrome P450 [Saccharopolyspora erythraea]QUH00455.1 cytochrome P450 [Saccharopolyspora erythraea]